MALISGDLVYYNQIVPRWRQSKPCSNAEFYNPLFRQSSMSTHFALRSFSAWFLSYIKLGLTDILPPREREIPLSCTLEAITLATHSDCDHGWFAEASQLLQLITISPKHLPPFSFSLDGPTHLLLTWKTLNQSIRENIYKLYIQVTWTSPLVSLGSKMSIYL